MRRSKRLAAKRSNVSETEESNQEEVADVKEQNEEETANARYYPSECGFTIDKTGSNFVSRDHEDRDANDCNDNDDDDRDDDDEEDNDVDGGEDRVEVNIVCERLTSSRDEEDFITLSAESKKSFKDSSGLSSELQVDIDTQDLYLKFDRNSFKPASLNRSFVELAFNDKELLKRSVITSDFEKRHSVPPMHTSQYARRKQKKKAREETAGSMWFNLPATQLTPEIEQDMKIMKMRNILDRKRHYKKNDSSGLPKYFQIGTVVEGSADFYTSRVPKRQRKSNMIDELLSDAEFRRYNKKKYLEIQAAKQSGKKGFYKKKMNKRKSTWSRT